MIMLSNNDIDMIIVNAYDLALSIVNVIVNAMIQKSLSLSMSMN